MTEPETGQLKHLVLTSVADAVVSADMSPTRPEFRRALRCAPSSETYDLPSLLELESMRIDPEAPFTVEPPDPRGPRVRRPRRRHTRESRASKQDCAHAGLATHRRPKVAPPRYPQAEQWRTPARSPRTSSASRRRWPSHDRENPTHTAHGIGLVALRHGAARASTRARRSCPGITIHADSGVTGNFRVLCDGEHDEELSEAEERGRRGDRARGAVPASRPGRGARPDDER